jgi:hypothetical protein
LAKTFDPFTALADWLNSPVSIPIASSSDPDKFDRLTLLALDIAERLDDLRHKLDFLLEFKKCRKTFEEVGERLNILRVALRRWADEYRDT